LPSYPLGLDIGKVIGTVVCTIKDPKLEGMKLLLLQPTDHRYEPAGAPFVALDGIGCGRGEYVFYETSREAPFAYPDVQPPVDAAIVGILDSVHDGITGMTKHS